GDFAGRATVDEDIEFRLALNINKAGRYNQAGAVDSFFCGCLAEIADSGNSISRNRNVARNPGGTRSIDDLRSAYDEIVLALFRDCGCAAEEQNQKQCGKGKLQFAIHGHLAEQMAKMIHLAEPKEEVLGDRSQWENFHGWCSADDSKSRLVSFC